MYNVKILSTGRYLPERILESAYYDKKFNLPQGTIERKSGIFSRHIVDNETISFMGANASQEAISKINFNINDIDCIICASGVVQQLIPCSASLIAKELNLSDIACFDVNSTCLGFICAMEVAASLIGTGKYKNVLIVCSDISSVGLDYDDMKSCILFGDGAAAILVGQANDNSKVITTSLKTYPEGTEYTCIKGGGTGLYSTKINENNKKDYLFYMNGEKIYALASKHMTNFLTDVLKEANLTLNDIKLIIPHQASGMSLKLIQRKLKVPDKQVLFNIKYLGNTISASIPLALDDAIKEDKIQRGDKVLFLGTSAGLTIGAMIIEY